MNDGLDNLSFGGTRPAWPRRLVKLSVGAIVLLLVLFAGAGWYYSSQLLAYPDFSTAPYDDEVTQVDGSAVTVTADGFGMRFDGTHALEWEDGYAVVGPIADTSGCCVTRPVLDSVDLALGDTMPVGGTVPTVGTAVRSSLYVATSDPASVGVTAEPMTIAGPLGDYDGWYAPAEGATGSTVAIFVHGRGGELREGFRILPSLVAAGLPTYVISYRNDGSAPTSPDGYGRLGLAEWEDLDAWVGAALDRGAERVVLVGYSQGGSLVSLFLRRSAHADAVSAVILDSPAVDWDATLRLQAEGRGLPGPTVRPILFFGKLFSSLRAGIDWDALDHVAHAVDDYAGLPVLVFHGTADTAVPVAGSERFVARLDPDDVRFVEEPGAEHTRTWNADPAAYDAAVRAFLGDAVP